MGNELQVFRFKGKAIDIFTKEDINFEFDGDFLIHGKQTAQNLGYVNDRDAINSHTDADEKIIVKNSDVVKCDFRKLNNAGETFLTESGFYSLAFNSKLQSAKEFTKWVKKEVLPSIRRHGAYMTENVLDEVINNPDFGIKLLTELKKEKEEKKKLLEENEKNKPKVLFAEAVSVAHTSILVGDLAKLIKQNGVDIGAKRLFAWLRKEGYLIKRKGTDYNMPTQYSMDLGLFEVKETSITHSDGHISISKTPKITGKGQIYFINKFMKNQAENEVACTK